MIQELREQEETLELPDLYDAVCEKSQYIKVLEEKNDMESRGRHGVVDDAQVRQHVLDLRTVEKLHAAVYPVGNAVALEGHFQRVGLDEYQDTNHLQYLLARLLAGGYENICVVGDDDQSWNSLSFSPRSFRMSLMTRLLSSVS